MRAGRGQLLLVRDASSPPPIPCVQDGAIVMQAAMRGSKVRKERASQAKAAASVQARIRGKIARSLPPGTVPAGKSSLVTKLVCAALAVHVGVALFALLLPNLVKFLSESDHSKFFFSS